MSTRPDTTHDDATTSPRTNHLDDFSTTQPRPGSDDSAKPSLDDDSSWTDRCKRQFATADTTRCTNLADDANEAMHDGV